MEQFGRIIHHLTRTWAIRTNLYYLSSEIPMRHGKITGPLSRGWPNRKELLTLQLLARPHLPQKARFFLLQQVSKF